MRIFGGIFMGIIFLVVGVILLLNSIFNFNINMFKLILGIIIVLFGVFILFNGFGFEDSRNIRVNPYFSVKLRYHQFLPGPDSFL